MNRIVEKKIFDFIKLKFSRSWLLIMKDKNSHDRFFKIISAAFVGILKFYLKTFIR